MGKEVVFSKMIGPLLRILIHLENIGSSIGLYYGWNNNGYNLKYAQQDFQGLDISILTKVSVFKQIFYAEPRDNKDLIHSNESCFINFDGVLTFKITP